MKMGIQKKLLKHSEAITAYLCLTPAIIGLLVLTILPLFGVILIGFTEWSGLRPPSFVGLQNYVNLFTKDLFFTKSIVVTLYYALGAVVGGILYSFILAMMLNRKMPLRGFWRAVFYLPYIVPAMAVNILWAWMYDANFGLFNYILNSLGLQKSMWLYSERTSVPSLVLMAVWTSGNLVVIFLAGLQNVPRVYHEAAEIDGANPVQRFIHITVPMMTPIIFYNFLISVITAMQVFVPAFSLTNGGPNNSTLFMVYLIYREGFMRNNFGYASSISFIFFIFIALITGLIFGSSNKWMFYEGK